MTGDASRGCWQTRALPPLLRRGGVASSERARGAQVSSGVPRGWGWAPVVGRRCRPARSRFVAHPRRCSLFSWHARWTRSGSRRVGGAVCCLAAACAVLLSVQALAAAQIVLGRIGRGVGCAGKVSWVVFLSPPGGVRMPAPLRVLLSLFALQARPQLKVYGSKRSAALGPLTAGLDLDAVAQGADS
jgi:hypothetical protein